MLGAEIILGLSRGLRECRHDSVGQNLRGVAQLLQGVEREWIRHVPHASDAEACLLRELTHVALGVKSRARERHGVQREVRRVRLLGMGVGHALRPHRVHDLRVHLEERHLVPDGEERMAMGFQHLANLAQRNGNVHEHEHEACGERVERARREGSAQFLGARHCELDPTGVHCGVRELLLHAHLGLVHHALLRVGASDVESGVGLKNRGGGLAGAGTNVEDLGTRW
mmetsp:Transcript_61897/g.178155  ORF Transcript_61897/g.178155 Transcript_61897/m.178155 type:complete len:227 (-) Transcript_61897:213-893(-)